MLDHILQKRGPKRWPPGFFTGQAGCYCCPPPPPPPPSRAVYYPYAYSSDLRACCFYPGTGLTGLPPNLTLTITGGTCTCLQGLSFPLVRMSPTNSANDLCTWVTSGSACNVGSVVRPSCTANSPINTTNTNARFQTYSCASANRSIGFAVRIGSFGNEGHSTGDICCHVCLNSIFGDSITQSIGILVSSCNPLVWVSNPFNVSAAFFNLCGLGSGVSGTIICTVTT